MIKRCWRSPSATGESYGFCIKNEGFCIENEEFCIKHDGLCIENDEFCVKNDEFRSAANIPPSTVRVRKEHKFCIQNKEFCINIKESCIKNDDCVLKTRKFYFKMMNSAGTETALPRQSVFITPPTTLSAFSFILTFVHLFILMKSPVSAQAICRCSWLPDELLFYYFIILLFYKYASMNSVRS